MLAKIVGREALERVGARGGFATSNGLVYQCRDGMCVMAALLADAGMPPLNPFPRYSLALGMLQRRAADGEMALSEREEELLERAVFDLMELNDAGKLPNDAAVRRALGL